MHMSGRDRQLEQAFVSLYLKREEADLRFNKTLCPTPAQQHSTTIIRPVA